MGARMLGDLVAWAEVDPARVCVRHCVCACPRCAHVHFARIPARSTLLLPYPFLLLLRCSPTFTHRLPSVFARVPLGKCRRRRDAPADLTIDKGALPDLLSFGCRKKMSFEL